MKNHCHQLKYIPNVNLYKATTACLGRFYEDMRVGLYGTNITNTAQGFAALFAMDRKINKRWNRRCYVIYWKPQVFTIIPGLFFKGSSKEVPIVLADKISRYDP